MIKVHPTLNVPIWSSHLVFVITVVVGVVCVVFRHETGHVLRKVLDTLHLPPASTLS